MVIDGRVFDVTNFVESHPGGPAILQGCGTDATALFYERPSNGTPHSASAQALRDSFEIGVLAE
jgi:cytochrome b involved in lipid metabolism